MSKKQKRIITVFVIILLAFTAAALALLLMAFLFWVPVWPAMIFGILALTTAAAGFLVAGDALDDSDSPEK